MIKHEAAFQRRFNSWLRSEFLPKRKQTSYAFELKYVRFDAMPFSAVKEHQRDYLLTAKKGRMVYKIPDDSRNYKPFDSFALCGAESYVVVLYPSKKFYLIDIEDFLAEEKSSIRKSLPESRAQTIGMGFSFSSQKTF